MQIIGRTSNARPYDVIDKPEFEWRDSMQIIADRRYLHTIPELGRELPLTTQYVTQKLSELELPTLPAGWLPTGESKSVG